MTSRISSEQTQTISDAMSAILSELRLVERSFESDIGAAGMRALHEICCHGIRTTAELAATLEIDTSAASRLIGSLTKAGLVRVAVDVRDKRQKPIFPTKRGDQLVEESGRQRQSVSSEILSMLSRGEQGVVEEGLTLFLRALKKSRLLRGYDIRKIRENDNAQVTQLIRKVMLEFGFEGAEYFAYPEEFSAPFESFQKKLSAYFVAVREETIVGCGGIAKLEDAPAGICELRKLFISPDARRAGLGTRLLETCLEAGRKCGYRRCYVETTSRMALGKSLYEKNGFKRSRHRLGPCLWKACDEWYIRDL